MKKFIALTVLFSYSLNTCYSQENTVEYIRRNGCERAAQVFERTIEEKTLVDYVINQILKDKRDSNLISNRNTLTEMKPEYLWEDTVLFKTQDFSLQIIKKKCFAEISGKS